jgi:hypothetical protein
VPDVPRPGSCGVYEDRSSSPSRRRAFSKTP